MDIGHVHLSLRILVNKNNSVFDDSGLILASINLACSEVLNINLVTHTPRKKMVVIRHYNV